MGVCGQTRAVSHHIIFCRKLISSHSEGTKHRQTKHNLIVNYKLVLAMVACHLSLQGVNYELLSKLQLLTFNTL